MLRPCLAYGSSSVSSVSPVSALSSSTAAAVAGAVFFSVSHPGPCLLSSSAPSRCSSPLPSLSSLKAPGHRLFHNSCHLLQGAGGPNGHPGGGSGGGPAGMDSQSHYDTLDVPLDASMGEIKKSFYRLSKLHHPDHNPHDPHAPRRFMRVSEAYAVLGHPDKRAVYDRDVVRTHHRTRNHRAPANPNASYHSTGPAGGRPASGLSRRRSAFHGPPPSFYRNTGSGGAAVGSTSSSSSPHRTRPAHHAHGTANPADARANPFTPHFDRDANERTLRHLDSRSAQRRAAAEQASAAFTEPTMTLGFLVITAALVAGVVVPVAVMESWERSGSGGGGGGGGGSAKRKAKSQDADV